MKQITELKRQVLQRLQEAEELRGVKLLGAYPALRRGDPLVAPVIAVGVDSVECASGGLGGYWGEQEQQALYGGAMLVTLRFDLYLPALLGGERLHELYEELCDALMLRRAVSGVQKLWCGEIEQDKTTLALHLTAKAVLRAVLSAQQSGVPLSGVEVRRKTEDEGHSGQ